MNSRISLKNRALSRSNLASFGLAAALIALLVTQLELDWPDITNSILSSDLRFYLLAVALHYTTFPIRGLRWRLLARNAGIHSGAEGRVPSTLQCSQFVLLGGFANVIGWFRMGEAYRAYLFSREARCRFSFSFGITVADRVIDMAAGVLVLLIGALAVSWSGALRLPLLLLGVAFAMMATLGIVGAMMLIFGDRVSRFLPQRIQRGYFEFREGMFGSFGRQPLPFALSLLGWALEVGRFLAVTHALGIGISISLATLVAGTNSILTAIPFTPGGLGIVEPGVSSVLMLHLARPPAVAAMLLDRSITYASIVVLGGLLLILREATKGWKLTRNARAEQTTDGPS